MRHARLRLYQRVKRRLLNLLTILPLLLCCGIAAIWWRSHSCYEGFYWRFQGSRTLLVVANLGRLDIEWAAEHSFYVGKWGPVGFHRWWKYSGREPYDFRGRVERESVTTRPGGPQVRLRWQATGFAWFSHVRGAGIHWWLSVPLWALVLVTAAPALRVVAAVARRQRRARRERSGLCGRCGYALLGNVSGVCPECGTPAAVQLSPSA